jgi:hypothetical protein
MWLRLCDLSVACVFNAAGMCLPSHCLAVSISSGSTIQLSGGMSQYYKNIALMMNFDN